MGKSLSILALTMKTLDDGKKWAQSPHDTDNDKARIKYSRSTLIVVSASCRMDTQDSITLVTDLIQC